MRYLVIYNITDDNLRTLVAESLKDYGLTPTQYNAFIGHLRRDKLNSLVMDLKNLIKKASEDVQFYPVCDNCFRGRREVGKQKRYRLVEEKAKVAYF